MPFFSTDVLPSESVSYATYFSCLKLSQTQEWTFKTCLIILVFEDFDNFISMIVRLRDRYLKNDVSKSIVHVIKHANFSFIRYILLKLFGKTDKWRQLYKQTSKLGVKKNKNSFECCLKAWIHYEIFVS